VKHWVSLLVVRTIHEEQIAEHGGVDGVHDPAFWNRRFTDPKIRKAMDRLIWLISRPRSLWDCTQPPISRREQAHFGSGDTIVSATQWA
jgi:hypothetical protein